ncbi:MAG: RNA pseudouridine synthase, partial [Myxococcota bacterium]|nr:RNA pseudouridine synthase [Myxococcota bacterium]
MPDEPDARPAPDEPLDRAHRERTFAWLDPRWILREDDALIAIDKPAGVPAQEAREGAEDDLPTRVARFLAERDGGEPYVGVHQRLDKETSGVVLYARSREANPALARQLEARSVEKTYVAGVERWSRRGEVTLRDALAPGDAGRVTITTADDRRGKLAITHARELERGAGGRALLEVRIETGRTHQIRAQLA